MPTMQLAPANSNRIIEREINNCENIGLRFNLFTPVGDGKKEVSRGNRTVLVDDKKSKFKAELPTHMPSSHLIKGLLQGYHERKCAFFKQLKSNNYAVKMVCVKSCSRVAIGMGNDHPSENGLSFQYPLGFPIIPGSAIKGVTKHYVELFCDKNSSSLQRIFGSSRGEGQKGSVLFFDAYPAGKNLNDLLESDVMTPHYGNYYSLEGKKPSADYDTPVIINFLTVPEDTAFYFQIASRCQNDLRLACEWFQEARTKMGIGGKTNVGYGRFSKAEEEIQL